MWSSAGHGAGEEEEEQEGALWMVAFCWRGALWWRESVWRCGQVRDGEGKELRAVLRRRSESISARQSAVAVRGTTNALLLYCARAGGTLRIPLCLVDQLGLPLRLPPGPLRNLLTAHTRAGLQRAGSAAGVQQAAERLAVGGGTARDGQARAPEREDLGQACEVVGWEWPEDMEEQEQGGQSRRNWRSRSSEGS